MNTTTYAIAKAIVEGYRESFSSTKIDEALRTLCEDLVDAQMALDSCGASDFKHPHRASLLGLLAADIEDLVDDEKPVESVMRICSGCGKQYHFLPHLHENDNLYCSRKCQDSMTPMLRVSQKGERTDCSVADAIKHLSASLCIPDDDLETLDAWREQLNGGRPLTTLSGATYRQHET